MKRRVVLSIIILLLAGGLLSADKLHKMYIKSQLEPEVELQEAIKNMQALKSYRYDIKSGFTIEQREEVISEVSGEKDAGKTHIKGEMVKTEIDIYYLDRTIYNYDSLSDKWLVIESSTSGPEELLISELNPLSNFIFKQIDTVEKVGFEEVDGVDCLLIEHQSEIESKLLETLCKFVNIRFGSTIRIEMVRKSCINPAQTNQSPTHLKILSKFNDSQQRDNHRR